MSAPLWVWMSSWVALDTAALPAPWLMRWALCLGWGAVLAWAGASVVRAQARRVRMVVAVGLFVWCWVPGPLGPVHWLGLAFQMPSISTVLLCAGLLYRRLRPAPPGFAAQAVGIDWGLGYLAALGVVLGWLLLLDTLALLPVPWYAWGFSPLASALVWGAAVVPWVLGKNVGKRGHWVWVAPLAVVLFVVLRLPTGNVWDAVLDPWLWVALHGYGLRAVWRSRQAGRSA